MRRGNDIDRKIALLYLIGFIVWKKKYIDIFFYQSLTLYCEIFSIMKMENSLVLILNRILGKGIFVTFGSSNGIKSVKIPLELKTVPW